MNDDDNDLDTNTNSNTKTNTTEPSAYFERQSYARCAVHAVNNLLQQAKFTRQDFDRKCEELSPSTFFGYFTNV